jgi:hypothetical protein
VVPGRGGIYYLVSHLDRFLDEHCILAYDILELDLQGLDAGILKIGEYGLQ